MSLSWERRVLDLMDRVSALETRISALEPSEPNEVDPVDCASCGDVHPPIEACADNFTINLDRYERDNLLALLHLIYQQPAGPFVLASGDWAGQIYWKLASGGFDKNEHRPNMTPRDQLKSLLHWAESRNSDPAFTPWPSDQPPNYNACTDPCDMWTGPCACGGWHKDGK